MLVYNVANRLNFFFINLDVYAFICSFLFFVLFFLFFSFCVQLISFLPSFSLFVLLEKRFILSDSR